MSFDRPCPPASFTTVRGRQCAESKNLSQRALLTIRREYAHVVDFLFLRGTWKLLLGPADLSNDFRNVKMTVWLWRICTNMLPERMASGAVDIVVDGRSALLFKLLPPVRTSLLEVKRILLTLCVGPISSWSQGLGLSAYEERGMLFWLESASESWMELQ